MYKNRPYFNNSGLNWSKLGGFVDQHYILHVIDLIFGYNWKRLCNRHFLIVACATSLKH